MNEFASKIQRLSQNQPTYQAYPPIKRELKNSRDTINVDTVERSARLNIDRATNSSY